MLWACELSHHLSDKSLHKLTTSPHPNEGLTGGPGSLRGVRQAGMVRFSITVNYHEAGQSSGNDLAGIDIVFFALGSPRSNKIF